MADPLLGANERTSLREASPATLQEYQARYPDRGQAMAEAYLSHGFTMQEIADYFGVSTKTVGRMVKQYR